MAEEPDQQGEGAGGSFFSGSLFKMLMFYFVASQVLKGSPKSTSADVATPAGPRGKGERALAKAPVTFVNAWAKGQAMDLSVYVTDSETMEVFDQSALLWHRTGLAYARDEHSFIQRNITLPTPVSLKRNESSLWLHVFVSKAGSSPDPNDPTYELSSTLVAHHPLVKHMKPKKAKATKNLLSGEFKDNVTQEEADALNKASSMAWVPHWKPALTVSAVEDFTAYREGQIPPQIVPSLTLLHERRQYLPVLFVNEFWLMKDQLLIVNESLAELPLELTFSVTTLIRWMLTVQMQTSMEAQATVHGADTSDELKRMLTSTSPFLLGLTAFVSMLHMLFDFLAFKNDISFWKDNKSMRGLSLSTMLMNLFFQTVIFLYLCDNDTSWMILMSNGIGLAIEVWKLRKAIKSVDLHFPEGSRAPHLRITPADSYVLSETKVHDEEAMRYLSMVMYPLVVGYSAYSLAMETHKSFYSWLLGSLVGCVYTFGFVMMTPQLFINYKLKSTAHMPWRTFMYKALNTFIDDLFAFIIVMPTMHRLSCLRDDVIFLVYLYQRWAYGVDTSRANEYGQVEADHQDSSKQD